MPTDPLTDPNHPQWEETAQLVALRESGHFNVSRHEPWWRAWLTSWQLFTTYRDAAPRVGRPVHTVSGGTVFEYRPEQLSIWVQVWLAPGEVVVAYPSIAEQYGGSPAEYGGLHEFAEWIDLLRRSPPLELGRTRDRSSYGARWSGQIADPPDVKWAQAGDWAALARNWYFDQVAPGWRTNAGGG